jgi:alkylhydroperoxidase family enzyme
VIRYAEKITYDPAAVADEDIQGLRRRFSDEQIVELTLAIAAYNMTNRFNIALGVELEPFFHQHGR